MKTLNRLVPIVLLIAVVSAHLVSSFAVERFPRPEFESGYVQPTSQLPSPRSQALAILDVVLLFVALSVTTWLVLKKRSRNGVFWITLFSLLYFGFFREGCICAVGSIQNITLALFRTDYAIPITVVLFFALPLFFTLFYGRTFCAGVCPLGAIQDIVALKPLPIKKWLQKVLGLIPYIYLGLAILYAATATDFVVCRYDPFVGIFRFDATFSMFALGGVLLFVGIFIARPYCRFLCPYGVILNLVSRVSKRHLTITPSACIQCKLCEDSCPYGAIERPVSLKEREGEQPAVKRLLVLSIALPLLIVTGGIIGNRFHENLASVNGKVRLANELLASEGIPEVENSVEVTAFQASGTPTTQLYSEALQTISEFRVGSTILGGFLGLVVGLTLFSLSIFRYQPDYTPNKGECLSCARCVDYCPVKPDGSVIERKVSSPTN